MAQHNLRLIVRTLAVLSLISKTSVAQNGRLIADQTISAEKENLTTASSIWMLPNKSLVIGQSADHRLVVFDSTGKLSFTVGRKGAGPGEFGTGSLGPSIVGGAIADTIWTYDSANRRFSWFHGKQLLRTAPLNPAFRGTDDVLSKQTSSNTRHLVSIAPRSVSADGMMLGIGTYGTVQNDRGEVYTRNVTTSIVRAGLQGSNVRLLLDEPVSRASAQIWTDKDSISRMASPVPYRVGPVTKFSPDGLRFAVITNELVNDSPQLHLKMFTSNGSLLYTRQWNLVKTQVTARMFDSALVARTRGFDEAAKRDPRIQRVRQRLRPGTEDRLEGEVRKLMPRYVERFPSVVLTADNHVWIGVPDDKLMLHVELINSTGTTISSIGLTHRERPVAGSAEFLWTSRADENDLDIYTRYRLR